MRYCSIAVYYPDDTILIFMTVTTLTHFSDFDDSVTDQPTDGSTDQRNGRVRPLIERCEETAKNVSVIIYFLYDTIL